MICPKCEQQINDDAQNCYNCGYEISAQARKMSRNERDSFQGITIDEDARQAGYQDNDYTRPDEGFKSNNNGGPRVYVRKVNAYKSSFLSIILIWLAVLLFIFFILPTFILIALALFALWFIFRLFK